MVLPIAEPDDQAGCSSKLPTLDQLDARNWTRQKKVLTTWIVSMFKFMSGLTSSSIVPNLASIALDVATGSGALRVLPLSAYFMGFAVGLLLIGPLSETFGRVGMLQASNMFFIIFNTAAGFSRTNAQIVVMRVLSGFGGAGPLSLGGGILNDCFTPEERTTMITVYALPGQLSIALGPILGAVCESYLSWRWTFWIVSIACVVLQIMCFLLVKETYKPALERRRERQMRASSGGNVREVLRDVQQRLRTNMLRPFEMLATHPIVQLLALFNGVAYGLQILVIASFEQLWSTRYGQPLLLGSLNYLALGVGLVAGAQIVRPLNKRVYRTLKNRDAEGQGRPEFRVPMVAAGALIVPVGLLWYGWSAEARAFPLVPDLGAFVFAMGTVACLNCTSLYLVDTYRQQSASATGAVNILRAIAGAIFPLFSSKLYESLGQGWGATVLAGIAVVLGWPVPIVLWTWGSKLRAKAS